MGLEKISLGAEGAFRVVLEWRDDYGSDGPIGKTWGDLQLWVGETLVWGHLDSLGNTQGITWSWVDVLEFLGNAWPYLIEEEQYPIAFNNRYEGPRHIGELWGCAKLRWRNLTEECADQEEARLRDFLVVHDLAEALQGACPTNKLLLLRQGDQMLAATNNQEWTLSFKETMLMFESLGDAINLRIADLADTRSEIARTRWESRDMMPKVQRLQVATGMDEISLRNIWPTDIDSDVANDALYVLKAAARMIGRRITESQLKNILARINALPKGKNLAIESLQKDGAETIKEHEGQDPSSQGYLLAAMLREQLKCKVGKVDPQKILSNWGVSIQELNDKDLYLDAIAVWGAEHAPTILLNMFGPRAHHPTGARSTLAHEICHLLVDKDGALPVAEVLGGNVSIGIEQRANAFAAEFLLPRAEAGKYIEKELQFVNTSDERRSVTERAINDLADCYGASHETTAWQILNSGNLVLTDSLKQELQKHLKSIYTPFDS